MNISDSVIYNVLKVYRYCINVQKDNNKEEEKTKQTNKERKKERKNNYHNTEGYLIMFKG